jgi:hypothetical protein
VTFGFDEEDEDAAAVTGETREVDVGRAGVTDEDVVVAASAAEAAAVAAEEEDNEDLGGRGGIFGGATGGVAGFGLVVEGITPAGTVDVGAAAAVGKVWKRRGTNELSAGSLTSTVTSPRTGWPASARSLAYTMASSSCRRSSTRRHCTCSAR